MNAYFYFPAPVLTQPLPVGEDGGETKERKDDRTNFTRAWFFDPDDHAQRQRSQRAPQATCLQEQFSGPLPLRSERPMAEILAERLAEADPDSPCPLFIP